MKKTRKQTTEKIQRALLGSGEPTYTAISSSKLDLINGLNYYSANQTLADSKKYALVWLKEHIPHAAKTLSSVHENEFGNRGFVCRMTGRGFCLSQKDELALYSFFTTLADSLPQRQEQTNIKEITRTNKVFDSVQYAVDSIITGGTIEPVSFAGCTKIQLKEISDTIQKSKDEITENPDWYISSTAKKLLSTYTSWLTSLSSGTVRKPRTVTPKKVKPQKIVALHKIAAPEIGLTGIKPESMLGKTSAVVFNTKYKVLIVYQAANANGFGFRKNMIENVQNNEGVSKRIKKPELVFVGLARTVKTMKLLYDRQNVQENKHTVRLSADCVIIATA